ncbi:MAG: sodium-translocating pyrophosphatase [Anaerolineales bacterium]|nr:sodium-translocating pyrophosphatase [Anaerolineales bacterium]MCB8953951.1 sodium-translocating pyrophosphatase [Ardenticatenales bacterium]
MNIANIYSSILPQSAGRAPLPLAWWLAPIGAIVALIFAVYFYRSVMERSEGNARMIEIAQAVREGAMAYLRQQYRIVALAFAALFLIFAILALVGVQNPIIPVAFLTGGLFSGLCGFIGMRTATNASARTAQAASESLNGGLQVALRAGAVMGLVVVGFALLDIAVWFLILYYVFPALFPDSFLSGANPLPQITATMLSFGMGASTQALFARVGGGIYTKAADVGADLVGKVEAGIPEDDPRNPATIADNVGDNVGDVAGMGADLYESYAGSILATAALGVAAVATASADFLGGVDRIVMQLRYLSAPMVLAAVGVFLSIAGIYFVRADEGASQQKLISALSRGLYGSSLGIAILGLGVVYLLELPNAFAIWIAIVTGLVVGIIVGKSTEYYTSHAYDPTRGIAVQAETSSATALIEGLAVGMESGGLPVAVVAIGIAISFYAAGGTGNMLMGLYGVGIAAVGMLSTLGFTLATDAYGPIADNAGGNAEMAGLPPHVRERTDQLDAVGNTTAATGKGFAIGSAALTSMALLAAYLEELRLGLIEFRGVEQLEIAGKTIAVQQMTIPDFMTYFNVTLLNPAVLIGIFAGAATAFYFSAMTMRAVGRAAGGMVEEVRRQFRELPGILQGTDKPDYARCVEISTASAQKEMIAPSVLAIAVPVVIGVLFGPAGVLGLLVGGLTTGFSLAVMMSNAGGAWDNAKKYIEAGAHGGKGSIAHKAAVVGDTVGDPFKDTSGPSLNILIKLMSMVSVVFAGLVVSFGSSGLVGMLLEALGK